MPAIQKGSKALETKAAQIPWGVFFFSSTSSLKQDRQSLSNREMEPLWTLGAVLR